MWLFKLCPLWSPICGRYTARARYVFDLHADMGYPASTVWTMRNHDFGRNLPMMGHIQFKGGLIKPGAGTPA